MSPSNNNNPPVDWAWPALIQSLQREITHLRDLIDEARKESSVTRDAHRRDIDALIEQLRVVKDKLDPILEEREAAKRARREMVFGWMGKGGWILIAGVGFAVWHYLTKHLRGEQ